MLAESGIQLGDVMVGADSFQQDNKQQQQAHQSDRGVSSMTETRTEIAGAAIEATVMPTKHHGIVNTYA
jgi:flagellar hook-length control protein FliK